MPRSRAFLATALLAPAVLHAALTGWHLATNDTFTPSALDHIVTGLVAAYTLGVFIALRTRRALHFALAAAATFFALACAEVAARIFLPGTGDDRPRQPMRAVSQVGKAMPGVTGEVCFTVNQLGLRAPEADLAAQDHRLLIVGGSAAECLYLTDEKSWPWRLGTLLSEQTGRRIYSANAAKSGHMAIHHAYLLEHYRLARKFDTVLVMCGINDLGACLRGAYELRAAAVSRETLAGWHDYGPYYHESALVRVALRLADHSRLEIVAQDAAGDWYDTERGHRQTALAHHAFTEPPADFSTAIERYQRDVEAIITICRDRQQHLVFITQPTLYAPDLPPATAALIWEYTDTGAYTPTALATMMQRFNTTLREVCAQHKVECIDLASTLSGDPQIFYDDCHFTLAGSERVAQLLADALRPSLR